MYLLTFFPMDLYITQHPASEIHSCITRLLLEINFSSFFYCQNFPLQNRTPFGRNLPLFR